MEEQGPFGDELRQLRMAAGLTQEELAERAGLSARAISDLERGAKNRPHPATVRQLARALDLNDEQHAELLRRRRPRRERSRSLRVEAADASESRINGIRSPGRLPVGGFLGALPEIRLVARERELTQILSAADAAVDGQGRVLLLVGEAGVGKTRMAQEVAVECARRGFLVATGRCYELRERTAFSPIADALTTLSGMAPALARPLERWPYLAPLLPYDSDETVLVPAEGGDRDRLFRAVLSFLQTLAGSAPVAILIDDLQWADSSSLDLLQHIARHTRGDRVLLIGTHREEDTPRPHPLRKVSLDLYREGLLERLEVRRLDRNGTDSLLAATLDEARVSPALGALVHRQTDGNPFFVREVIKALVERGDAFLRDGIWNQRESTEIPVPDTVRDALLERLGRLSESTRDLLGSASVLGQTFTFEELEALTEQPDTAVEEALDEATAAKLVRAGREDDYAFNHALTQQVLYEEIPPHSRRRLHRSVGAMLAVLTGPVARDRTAEVARHFLLGGDTERALPHLLAAGDRALDRFANREAEWAWRTAVSLARDVDGHAHLTDALRKLGALLSVTGRHGEAVTVLEEATQRDQTAGNLAGEVAGMVALAWAYILRREPDRAIERLEALLERAEDAAAAPQVDLLAALASACFVSGRYQEQLVVAARAFELAKRLDEGPLCAKVEIRYGFALAVLGRTVEAQKVLEHGIDMTDRYRVFDSLSIGLNVAGEQSLILGDFERTRAYWERALDVAERIGDLPHIGAFLSNLGQLSFFTGDWSAVHTYCEEAIARTASVERSWHSAYPLLHLGVVCLHRGDRELGSRLLEEGIAIARESDDIQAFRQACLGLAELDLVVGEPDRVPSRLEPLLDRAELEEETATRLLPSLAEAYLGMGHHDRAAATLSAAKRRTSSEHSRLTMVDVLRVQGMVLADEARWAEASITLGHALSLARDMGYPYMEGRVLHELGRLHAHRGAVSEAREYLQAALAIFRRLGAHPYAARTETALSHLGSC